MTHLTSQWAHRYGLADPEVPAAQVREAADGALRAACARFDAGALAMRFGGDRARHAVTALRMGWSTPQAEQATADISAAGHRLDDLCREASRHIGVLAEAVAAAHRDLDGAYAHADAVIAEERLDLEPLATTLDDAVRLAQRRCSLVAETHAAASSVLGRLEGAAAAAIRDLADDPRDLLPRGVTADLAAPRSGAGASSAPRIDAANRTALEADLHSRDARRVEFAHAVQHALDQATAAGSGGQLLRYDPDGTAGQGNAAVAVGDVAHADAVSVLVPGVANSPMDMSGAVQLAATLATATARAGTAGTTSASIVWFDYDIPLSWTGDRTAARGRNPVGAILADSMLALDATAAIPAAANLGAFTRDVRAMMPPSAGLTLIGHSYGSTVVSQAARRLGRDAGVDDIVLLGSPGAGYRISSAGDYAAVDAEHVYAVAFPADPIPHGITDVVASVVNPIGALARGLALGDGGGPFGIDPNSARFGAQSIMVPSGVSWNGGVDLGQHALGNYLSGKSLDAVATVTAGRYSSVPVRHHG